MLAMHMENRFLNVCYTLTASYIRTSFSTCMTMNPSRTVQTKLGTCTAMSTRPFNMPVPGWLLKSQNEVVFASYICKHALAIGNAYAYACVCMHECAGVCVRCLAAAAMASPGRIRSGEALTHETCNGRTN